MTFSIDNPGGLQQPPFGKYVWETPKENEAGKTCVKISASTECVHN